MFFPTFLFLFFSAFLVATPNNPEGLVFSQAVTFLATHERKIEELKQQQAWRNKEKMESVLKQVTVEDLKKMARCSNPTKLGLSESAQFYTVHIKDGIFIGAIKYPWSNWTSLCFDSKNSIVPMLPLSKEWNQLIVSIIQKNS